MYHIVGVTPEAATLEMALGSRKPVATIPIRCCGAAARVRIAQLQWPRSQRGLRDAGLSARIPSNKSAKPRGCWKARRSRTGAAVDVHIARGEERRRHERLHQDDPGRGRTGDDRHVLGRSAARCPREPKWSRSIPRSRPLSSGHGGHRSLVRHHGGLHPRGADGALERRRT